MMQERKLDQDVYNSKLKENNNEFETIKYALKDNFAQLLATDNFLEKYLPFKIQNIVSESLLSFLEKDSQHFKDFKQFEYMAYKRIHKFVLQDEGIPNLKKRGYQMPGYKKILEKDERDIYEQAISKQQQHRALLYVLGQKAQALGVDGCVDVEGCYNQYESVSNQLEDLGQEIVPIDEYSHASSDEFKTKKGKIEDSCSLTESSF